MGFRLVPISVTLNDTVIPLNLVAFGADYVKVADDTPILSATEM